MNTNTKPIRSLIMKKLLTLLVLAAATLIFAPERAKASHMAGVDITYQWTGNPNEFLVRLKFYRDCTGIDAPGTVTICYSSLSTGQSGSVTAPQIGMTPVANTPCVTAVPTCPGGIGDIEEYVYETIVVLPGPAPDWTFSWADCCRNNAITTLQPNGMYVSATLDNITAPTNSSPTFLNLAYTRFCVGNQFFYDQGATDIDGDSLVFSLVTAEDGNFNQCPNNPFPNTYIAPFSAINFCSSSIPITINSSTGVVNFVPSQVQVAVMCILVREYRNGVLIGQVKRDIQINIVSQCNQIFPSFNNGILTANNGQLAANCNDNQVVIPFDTTFQCASAVPSDFRVISPFGIPNPVINVQPINCSNGETDSLLITFLNPLTVGSTYLWIKKGFDGNTLLSECGSEIPEFADTINIVVTDNSVWGPAIDSVGCIFNEFTVELTDSVYCFSIANDGSDVLLVDAAGTNYPVANVYGYCVPNGLKTNSLLVEMANNISGTGPFYLLLRNNGGSDGNTLANGCGRFLTSTDTLAVLFVDSKIIVDLGPDQEICSFEPFPVLDCGYDSLSYQWYDQSGAISGATSQTYTPTTGGTYSVFISLNGGCSGRDTMNLTVIPAPSDNLGSDRAICINDSFPTFDAANPGATYQWLLNGNPIAGATAQTYSPGVSSATGSYTYSVEVNTGNAQCIGEFDVIINVISQPILAFADPDICSDQTATLDATFAGATSYLWSTGATTPTIQTNTANDYLVTVSVGNCSSTDTISLEVFNYPEAPVATCNPSTAGTYTFIYTWTAVNDAVGYEISTDNGLTWQTPNEVNGPQTHGDTLPDFIVRAIGSLPICNQGRSSDPVACVPEFPNIFTPNDDGVNDFFGIRYIEQYPNNNVQIFNRWGKEVFNIDGYDNDKRVFTGKDLPDGVYFFIVNLGKGKDPVSGSVTITR